MTTAFEKSKSQEWTRLIQRLDKAGVPTDQRWRTLILYMRNVRGFYFLSEKQKAQMQQLIVDTLKRKDYSNAAYDDIVKHQEDILLGPHKEKLRMAMAETQALLKDFKDLLMSKKGDVENLETLTVSLAEEETSPQAMISAMRKAFHEVVHTMEQDVANLTKISKTDALTQLFNRRAFDEELEKSAEHSLKNGSPLSLVMLDIDHFKKFNDTYGHRIGDQAIRVVAKVMQLFCSEVNETGAETTLPARYGGEEFTVILNDTRLREAMMVGEEIRKRVERYNFTIQDNSGNVVHSGIKITVSVGVGQLDTAWGGAYADNLVEAADKALYKAKECGRNRVSN